MFILFGWGKTTTKNLGPVFENLCTNCNRKEYWSLVRVRVWFTLFFIPVIPYGIKHFLLCPVCEYGIKLDRQKYDELRPIAEANDALVNGRNNQTQYINNLKQINIGQGNSDVATPTGMCSNCNIQNPGGTKFCKNCGKKL